MKLLFATSILVLGIGLAIFHAMHNNWLSAIALLLTALIASFTILIGFLEAKDMPILKALAAFAVLLEICAIFIGNPAFDLETTTAHNEATQAFAFIESYCSNKGMALTKLQNEGIMACATQSLTDQVNAISELQKSTVLGPTLSIIDDIRTATTKEKTDWCAETFKVTQPLCPSAFSQISKSSTKILWGSK